MADCKAVQEKWFISDQDQEAFLARLGAAYCNSQIV